MNGCDNFPTRYLANDACVMLKKPLVDGAIWQFEGQATVFNPRRRTVLPLPFPEPPPPGAVPSCAEAGVLGVLPGLVGCVQALEAIKLILGEGKPLIGRMMHFDTLAGEVRILKLRRDPNCAVCGEHPTVKELIDYEVFCGLAGPGRAGPGARRLSRCTARPLDERPAAKVRPTSRVAYLRSNLRDGRVAPASAPASRPGRRRRGARTCARTATRVARDVDQAARASRSRAMPCGELGRSNRRRWRWRVFGQGSGK